MYHRTFLFHLNVVLETLIPYLCWVIHKIKTLFCVGQIYSVYYWIILIIAW